MCARARARACVCVRVPADRALRKHLLWDDEQYNASWYQRLFLQEPLHLACDSYVLEIPVP